jgi:hypothetical protein
VSNPSDSKGIRKTWIHSVIWDAAVRVFLWRKARGMWFNQCRSCRTEVAERIQGWSLECAQYASPVRRKFMANSLLPPEERNLTPEQVEALDKRRELGHTFMVIAGQFSVMATVLLLWVGQDLKYSPGWLKPMAFYFFLLLLLTGGFGLTGLVLRRGMPRID